MDLYQFGFMASYKVWVHHDKSQHRHVEVEEHDMMSNNRMDNMIYVMWLKFELESKDGPMLNIHKCLTF